MIELKVEVLPPPPETFALVGLTRKAVEVLLYTLFVANKSGWSSEGRGAAEEMQIALRAVR